MEPRIKRGALTHFAYTLKTEKYHIMCMFASHNSAQIVKHHVYVEIMLLHAIERICFLIYLQP